MWVQVESTGLTGGSHDATDAKSTCTTRYRFSGPLSAEEWRIYVQQGQPKISGSIGGEILGHVCALAPTLLDEPGIGPIVAAQVIIAWSHPGRVRSEAAFARLAGVAPVGGVYLSEG